MLGVTGKYCAGKDAAVSILRDLGCREIDVDRIGHRVLEDAVVRRALASRFGQGIFDSRGRVDRRILGRRVFADPRELSALESVVHPPMVREVERSVDGAGGRIVINAALLFRMRLDSLCDAVVCVRAPLLKRLIRARRRDGSGLLPTLRRNRAQRGICPKSNAKGVDIYYVENNRGLDHLRTQILQILTEKGQANR